MRRMSSPGMYARCSAKSVDEPEVRRPVQAVDESFDDDLREQLEFPIRARTLGSRNDVGCCGARCGATDRHAMRLYIPDFGSGTAASSFSIT